MTICPRLESIDRRIDEARASGALEPIETRLAWVDDHGLRFPVRWMSSLAAKARVRAAQPGTGRRDPFLHRDARLELGDAGAGHVLLLNKYPVMRRHLLLVTRQFEPQDSVLEGRHFAAAASLLRECGGLCFYNGGEVAGASQPHRHLQWVPADADLPLLDGYEQASAAGRHAGLDFPHALAPLDRAALDARDAGRRLERTYRTLCDRAGLRPIAGRMPAYNLLFTSAWMLVVARARERWGRISINALGFAGSFFVSDPADIDAIRATGPLALLAAVAARRE